MIQTDELTRLIQVSRDSAKLTLRITDDLTDGIAKQLILKSHQPHILQSTPKDANERFSDEAALGRWRRKGRTVYFLLGAHGDLAGIIWYGKKPMPLSLALSEPIEDTFSIRLYENYLGLGLARPFMAKTLALYAALKRQLGEGITGQWIITDEDNHIARALYAKFGYQEVARLPGRVIMILPLEKLEAIVANA